MMGSKCRLGQKLRQNEEYRAILKFLAKVGLRHTLHPATGSQHPFIIISLPNGAEFRHSVACTPRGGGNPAAALAYLRRKLREVGYDVG